MKNKNVVELSSFLKVVTEVNNNWICGKLGNRLIRKVRSLPICIFHEFWSKAVCVCGRGGATICEVHILLQSDLQKCLIGILNDAKWFHLMTIVLIYLKWYQSYRQLLFSPNWVFVPRCGYFLFSLESRPPILNTSRKTIVLINNQWKVSERYWYRIHTHAAAVRRLFEPVFSKRML